jgi:hypothetical protein
MNRKILLSAFFASCLVFSLLGCSLFSSERPAKKSERTVASEPSNIEWKERKWESYAEDNGGVQYFFERESLDHTTKDLIYVWRKRIFPGKSSSQKEITSFDEIDCRTEKYRSLELQGLNWDDTTTIIYKRPTPWTPIFTDTPDYYFFNNFCRRTGTGDNVQGK